MNLTRTNTSAYIPSLIDEMLKNEWFSPGKTQLNSFPAVNIKENETGFILEIAAPGFDKKDFNIQLDNDQLTISCEKEAKEQTNEKYSRKEFYLKPFKRSFVLPETADTEKIKAAYTSGILQLDIPRQEEPKKPEPQRIKIS